MKKILSLLLALFVFIGCGGDDEPEVSNTTDPTEKPEEYEVLIHGTTFYNEYFKQRYSGKNLEDFVQESIYGIVGMDTTWVYGTKNGKSWLGIYDEHSLKLLKEWKGTEELSNPKRRILVPGPFVRPLIPVGTDFIFPVIEEGNMNKINNLFRLTDNGQIIELMLPGGCESNQQSFYQEIRVIDHILYIPYSRERYIPSLKGFFSLEGEFLMYDIKESEVMDDGSIFLSGFKGDKVWFAKCNTDYSIEKEWSSVEGFNRNIRHYEGYGEYKDGYLNAIQIEKDIILKMDWGYAFMPICFADWGNKRYGDIFLLNEGKAFYYTDNYYTGGFLPLNIPIRKWYNGSVLKASSTYKVISPEGKRIVELNTTFDTAFEDMEPASYTDGIYPLRQRIIGSDQYEYILKRIDYSKKVNETKVIWTSENLEDRLRPTDPSKRHRFSLTCIEKKDQIWTYSYEVVYIDGQKESINFKINIDTGKVVF